MYLMAFNIKVCYKGRLCGNLEDYFLISVCNNTKKNIKSIISKKKKKPLPIVGLLQWYQLFKLHRSMANV